MWPVAAVPSVWPVAAVGTAGLRVWQGTGYRTSCLFNADL